MAITVERTKHDPVPAGTYTATIASVESCEGNFGPQVKAKFLIEDEEYLDRALHGWASLSFSPKSKLFAWAKAAIFGGREIPDAVRIFDAETLVGRRVILVVTTERGTDGEVYNKIKDLLPYRAPKAQPASSAQPPAMQARATRAQPSQPSEPPDWPEWEETAASDPGPTDEDEA